MTSPSPRPAILAFGEVLWDIIAGAEQIGGAPLNFAAHAVRCGLRADLFSRVGRDARGERARREMERLEVGQRWVQADPALPTGWVDVLLDADGQPSYDIGKPAAWDAIARPAPQDGLEQAGFGALICGTLAQRSPASREALAELRRLLPQVPLFYDVNLRPPHTPLGLVAVTLPGADTVKLNESEAESLARELWDRALPARDAAARLRDDYGVATVVVTRGARGCLVLSASGEDEIEGTPVRVASAVGAGDAFFAAFVAGRLSGLAPGEAAARANRLGAWVASRPEAVPDYPPTLALELLVR